MVVRRGGSAMGCLVPLVLVVLAAYVGRGFGEAYFRYYQFQDAMKQEARFETLRSDDVITNHLRALADSLGLPPDAANIRISHSGPGAVIWSDYEETIELPFNHERTLHFHPSSEGGL